MFHEINERYRGETANKCRQGEYKSRFSAFSENTHHRVELELELYMGVFGAYRVVFGVLLGLIIRTDFSLKRAVFSPKLIILWQSYT